MPDFAAFFSYVFVVSFSPGPIAVLIMLNAGKFGYLKILKFLLGVSSGVLVILLLSNYFNLLLFEIMPKMESIMGIAGAIYMTYLAIMILKSKESKEINKDIPLNSFFTGMALTFVNPKIILYGITVTSNFIIPYYTSNMALFSFSFFLSLIGFASASLWALLGGFLHPFLVKNRKIFNITMAVLLIYGAISISGILKIIK